MRDVVNDPHNVRERVALAVEALATGVESIQDRLVSARIELAPLRADEFTDPDGRQLLDEIREALTPIDGTGGQGSTSPTTAKLSDEEAAEVARKIVMLDFVYRPL